ncbi:tigger transposable element-derived protein 4-like [Watersipora subatra]|uniref:tigger transposable element-derived protein 4-like n=1 Tax=Watersipora subatra TaxID=2589382 RepID=UPI00355B3D39
MIVSDLLSDQYNNNSDADSDVNSQNFDYTEKSDGYGSSDDAVATGVGYAVALDFAETNAFKHFIHRQVRSEGVPIDGPILLEKANKFLQDLGKDTTVSRGWIDRWKKRHSIGSQIVVGESAAVNVGEVEKWKEEVLTPLLQTYTYDDIFNMNETGLFYKLMVDKTLHFKREKCSRGKLPKERLTVALCANMQGTKKEVPIVIGKFKNLCCFKNVTNLPCQYYHNKKAWMKPDASINVLQAIRWVDRAWSRVTKETIANCFHHRFCHTNLDQTDATSTADDNEKGDTVRNLNLLLHAIDFTSNVTANELPVVDADITVAEHLSDAEIVQSVTYCGTLDESGRENEAEMVELDPPTLADANNALDVLRHFIDIRECKDYILGDVTDKRFKD